MKRPLPKSSSGFTLIEVMLAAVLAMVLMFGALYSTSESYEVVRESDRRLHTHIHARRALDRMLHDLRYCDDVAITGDAATGWQIAIDATSSLDPDQIVYNWSPATQELRVTDAGAEDDLVAAGVMSFDLTWLVENTEFGPKPSQVSVTWTMEVDAGTEAGLGAKEYTLDVGGSTWVRKFAPNF